MRLVAVMLAAGMVAGCQARGPQLPPPVTDTQIRRCELQARSSAAAIPNPFLAGAERGGIMRQCVEVGAMENRDAIYRRVEAEPGRERTAVPRARVAAIAERCGASEEEIAQYRVALAATGMDMADMDREIARGRTMAAGVTPGECAIARHWIAARAFDQFR